MNRTRVTISFLAALTGILTFSYAHAQTVSSCLSFPASDVSVALQSELSATVPDVPVGIIAVLKNEGQTPLHDGLLFARALDSSGNIIDQFVAQSGVDLVPGGSATSTFVWRVPLLLPAGDYRVTASFVSPKTVFVPPPAFAESTDGALALRVAGSVRGTVRFDGATLGFDTATYDSKNGVAYFDSAATSAVMRISVTNDSDTPYKGSVLWRLYDKGFSPLSQTPAPQTDVLELHPHTSAVVEHRVPVAPGQTYYLEADLGGTAHGITGVYLADKNTCNPGGSLAETFGASTLWLALIAALIAGGIMFELRSGKRITDV